MENEGAQAIEVQWRIDSWFKDLSLQQRDSLKDGFNLLRRYSNAVNLISPKSLPNADALHYADSILGGRMILSDIGSSGKTIFDIGSGNGFPGIVMAALESKHNFILVDSDQRKCEFLKSVAEVMKLRNVEVRCQSVEKLQDSSIQYAVTRGFANISKTCLLTRKVFLNSGSLYHFKGGNWSMEIAEMPTQLCTEWSPSLVGHYKLPLGDFEFSIVKTIKIAVR